MKQQTRFKSMNHLEDDDLDIDGGGYQVSPQTLKVSRYTNHIMKITPKVGIQSLKTQTISRMLRESMKDISPIKSLTY